MSPSSGTALDGLIEAVRALIPDAGIVHLSSDTIAPGPGSYLLLLQLQAPLSVQIAKREIGLPAGLYVYSGSARGPGGLKARLGRHLRGNGRPRWHVDQITTCAASRAGLSFRSFTECDLISKLLESSDFSVPIRGFGSSDCNVCPAHLIQFRACPEN
ncbi:GIY-YIG nuclease family protein [Nisaea sediminum]|uniref:GIY-YIG nuclease family protein n=1 Tax=Nisaea sediminum TaxID=2775867 RepID=UPI001867B95A|nr:GIY-YIG nuclease family protein [Nisaea sediminum]